LRGPEATAEGYLRTPNRRVTVASIRKEAHIQAPPERIWDALRDVGALHTRLVPGFVVDTRMDGNARIVTFGNGMVAREEIVDVDAAGGARFVWTADLLPNDLAAGVNAMMEAGIAVMKKTLEAPAPG